MTETSVAQRERGPSPAQAASGGGATRRRRLRTPAGLPWTLPALVLCVGLIYYCIEYTGLISTWNWDGIDPDPRVVGGRNYARIAVDPIFWAAIQHTIVFFVVTFVIQT